MNDSRDELDALISAYLDDELSVEERTAVEQLLADDPSARTLFAELQAIRGALQSLPRARASSDMIETIRARMEREVLLGTTPLTPVHGRKALPAAQRWIAAAAIVLMASTGGYILWHRNAPRSLIDATTPLAMSERPSSVSRSLEEADGDSAVVGLDDKDDNYGVAVKSMGEPLGLADAAETRNSIASPASPPAAAPAPQESEFHRKGTAAERQPESLVYAEGAAPAKGDELLAPRMQALQKARGEPLHERLEAGQAREEGEPEPESLADGAAGAGGAVVLTVACDDASIRQQLMYELSSSALVVQAMTDEAGVAVTTMARRGRAMEPRLGEVAREKELPAAAASQTPASSRGSIRHDLELAEPADHAAPKERGVNSLELQPADGRNVTDLVVVVADEEARQKIVARLGAGSDSTLQGDWYYSFGGGFGRYAATTRPVRMFYSLQGDRPAGGPDLPEDSIVFREGDLQPDTDALAASRPAAPARRAGSVNYTDGGLVATDEAGRGGSAASEPAAPVSGESEEMKSFATSRPAVTELFDSPGAERYVLRLYIQVAGQQPGETRPADRQAIAGRLAAPASAPAAEINYDPSVLDLQAPPARPPASSRPATDEP